MFMTQTPQLHHIASFVSIDLLHSSETRNLTILKLHPHQ